MPALAELLSCVQVLKYSICALSTSATKVTHSMQGITLGYMCRFSRSVSWHTVLYMESGPLPSLHDFSLIGVLSTAFNNIPAAAAAGIARCSQLQQLG
jgi:hypothetical protein